MALPQTIAEGALAYLDRLDCERLMASIAHNVLKAVLRPGSRNRNTRP